MRLQRMIRRRRRALKLSQTDVAEQCAIFPSMLCAGETGTRNFTIEQIVNLAVVLRFNPLHLLRMWFFQEKPTLHAKLWGDEDPFISQIPASSTVDQNTLTSFDATLLARYHALPPSARVKVRRMLDELLEPEPIPGQAPVLAMRRSR